MEQVDYRRFYERVVPRLFEVATYQRLMCGKVTNLGKNAQTNVTQTDIHGALTYIDQFTQDYLLIPVYQNWPDLIPLVEEDTGLKRCNLYNDSDYSLIMDPIDGTAFYLRGERDYSIMLGLMYRGSLELGIVCYPEDELIIGAIKGQGAWSHRRDGSICALPEIDAAKVDYGSVSCHYRLTREPYAGLATKLTGAGYSLSTNDDGFGTNATGILRVANGESCAFIGPHMALHDFSVPAFIIQSLGGVVRLLNYDGLEDTDSWSTVAADYGRPDPAASNPRYRVIIADADKTVDRIVATIVA